MGPAPILNFMSIEGAVNLRLCVNLFRKKLRSYSRRGPCKYFLNPEMRRHLVLYLYVEKKLVINRYNT
jgi:hypothetical protein